MKTLPEASENSRNSNSVNASFRDCNKVNCKDDTKNIYRLKDDEYYSVFSFIEKEYRTKQLLTDKMLKKY